MKCCARGVALGRLSIKSSQTWTPVEAWVAQVRSFHGPNTGSSTQVPLFQLPTPAAHAPLPRPHSCLPPAGTPADSAATAREPPASASAAPPAEPELRGAPAPALPPPPRNQVSHCPGMPGCQGCRLRAARRPGARDQPLVTFPSPRAGAASVTDRARHVAGAQAIFVE